MREIELIVVHCSATPPSMDIGAAEIREWHTSPDPRDPSKPWSDIGYHRVITRSGEIEMGRPDYRTGAHAAGFNAGSLAVCIVGGIDEIGHPQDNYNSAQMRALATVVRTWLAQHPLARVVGHRDLNPNKACPCFDVPAWWQSVQTDEDDRLWRKG